MHEFGLCEALLRAVEKRAAGRRVTGVTVRIGTAHAVVEPALAQSFEMVAMGGCAADATLELVTVPGEEFTLQSIRVVQDDTRAQDREPEDRETAGRETAGREDVRADDREGVPDTAREPDRAQEGAGGHVPGHPR
ncbi:hydrogenase/urease maturation nickel metallochaperone HypA [Actinomadura sp. 9N407]|uniref:hydrogenase/urease maturation nickel metallochaperone HypA n=1 Tax=Actinomadura sp. 9N407 TaxID=3375154 RepID=UPI0037BBB1DA